MARPRAKQYLEGVLKKYGTFPGVLDVGAGEDPNFYEDLFPVGLFDKLDLAQNKAGTIKWVRDVHDLDGLPPCFYDLAICMETLEHLQCPGQAVDQVKNIVKPGGILVVTTVACWGVHGHPKDYWRILPDGMEFILRAAGLEILEVKLEQANTAVPCGVFATARRRK